MTNTLNDSSGVRVVGGFKRRGLARLGWASLVLGLGVSACQGGDVDSKGPGYCTEGACESTGSGETVEAAEAETAARGEADSTVVPGVPLRTLDTCPTGTYYDPRTGSCRMPYCPTGSPNCDPETNGRGIYALDEQGHCFRDDAGQALFCPEGFVNTPEGVRLRLRGARDAGFVYEAPVRAWRVEGGAEREVALRHLGAERSQLAVAYGEGPRFETNQVARGAVLGALRFEFHVEAPPESGGRVSYALKMRADDRDGAPAGGAEHYRMVYKPKGAAGASWRAHCASKGEQAPVAFVGGTSVDGQSGRASEAPGVTAMSCQGGAVDACVAWGYGPWADPKTGAADAERRALFAACVHAKRAAYLADVGDATSFTKNGTRIVRGDTLGINPFPAERLEALWGPKGALCINRENLRRPELGDAVPELLPPCSIADVGATALFATGLPPDTL